MISLNPWDTNWFKYDWKKPWHIQNWWNQSLSEPKDRKPFPSKLKFSSTYCLEFFQRLYKDYWNAHVHGICHNMNCLKLDCTLYYIYIYHVYKIHMNLTIVLPNQICSLVMSSCLSEIYSRCCPPASSARGYIIVLVKTVSSGCHNLFYIVSDITI